MMQQRMGFFTDTSVCIGCKACEVACKQWNRLPAADGGATRMSGESYDNTRRLDSIHWRHVKFIEQFSKDRRRARWLMMSDVCKHCVRAPCLEACPTNAIVRTEFDTVVIQPDVCKGIGLCVDACPFGVIAITPPVKIARKCTLCYDRISNGMTPACAQTCPTDSIRFGPVAELIRIAEARVDQLHRLGETQAFLYGADRTVQGGLNSFYLLLDEPGVYGLPDPTKRSGRQGK
jgi:formate dehydrogenase iron-sulfur subunit